jgi:hypothetical protein
VKAVVYEGLTAQPEPAMAGAAHGFADMGPCDGGGRS